MRGLFFSFTVLAMVAAIVGAVMIVRKANRLYPEYAEPRWATDPQKLTRHGVDFSYCDIDLTNWDGDDSVLDVVIYKIEHTGGEVPPPSGWRFYFGGKKPSKQRLR